LDGINKISRGMGPWNPTLQIPAGGAVPLGSVECDRLRFGSRIQYERRRGQE
jgi:hypothetical protein